MSGLTVNSPDESMEEGHRVILQSPGGHLEDKTFMGTGQKVGHCRQRGNFDVAGRRSEVFSHVILVTFYTKVCCFGTESV